MTDEKGPAAARALADELRGHVAVALAPGLPAVEPVGYVPPYQLRRGGRLTLLDYYGPHRVALFALPNAVELAQQGKSPQLPGMEPEGRVGDVVRALGPRSSGVRLEEGEGLRSVVLTACQSAAELVITRQPDGELSIAALVGDEQEDFAIVPGALGAAALQWLGLAATGGPTVPLKVKRLHSRAVLPRYATSGAACLDLCAVVDGPFGVELDEVRGRSHAFRTGLAVEVPPGWALMIYSRSGHGFNNSTRLGNCVGVIDSDYRGEVMVKLQADAASGLTVRHGDRIAQAMLVRVPRVELVEVEELSETARGAGGLGSTGA